MRGDGGVRSPGSGPRATHGVSPAYSGAVFALALVLIALGLAVGVVGVLAATHRLPRNRVIGVRTRWTMGRVDAFRRANGAAAPALLAAGGVGTIGGVAAAASSGATAVTLVVGGLLGLLVLLGTAGALGARYAAADEAAETAARTSGPSGPCTLDAPEPQDAPEPCVAPSSSCAGTCALCPRAG